MPRTKYGDRIKAQKAKYDPLLILIRGTMAVKGIEISELANAIGACEATVYNRFGSPQDFRIKELEGITHKLGIPWKDVVNAMSCMSGTGY